MRTASTFIAILGMCLAGCGAAQETPTGGTRNPRVETFAVVLRKAGAKE